MESPEAMAAARTHCDAESLLTHADFLRALVGRLVADEATADDIVQATWLSAIKHPPRKGGSVRAWLYRVAQNHVRQLRRGEGRRSAREQDARRSAQVPSAADIVQRESARRTVVGAVVDLPESYREVVLLRFYEDLPPRAVARALGIPVETVRTRTRRGLALLRTRLDSEYGQDRKAWTLALLPLLMRPSAETVVSGSTLAIGAAAVAATCCLVIGWELATDRDTTRAHAAAPDELAVAAPVVALEAAPPSMPIARTEAATLAPEGELESTELSATPTTRLAGRVVDSTGEPVPGAAVLAFEGHRPRFDAGPRGARALQRTLSGPTGEFELSGLPLEFFLRAERGDLVSTGGLAGEFDRASELEGVELVVTPGFDLHGTVVDSSGEAVANCRIEVRTQARRGYVRPTAHAGLVTGALAIYTTESDAHGRFTLAGLPAVKHYLGARHPDFAPGGHGVVPGRAEGLTVVLPEGARTRVSVFDADGRPVEGCELHWVGENGAAASASADALGHALLPAVPVGSRGRVFARHAGMGPTYSPALAAGGAVRIELARAQAVSGTVIDEAGLAIAGARVEARAAAWPVSDESTTRPTAHAARGGTRTDAEGRFHLGGLGYGAHELVVTVPGSLVPGVSVDASPGPEPVTITVDTRAPGAISVRGVVRDALTGEAPQSVVITARGPDEAVVASSVRGGGEFQLQLPHRATDVDDAGPWVLVFKSPGYAPRILAGREYTRGSGPLDVELLPTREVELVLRDARGEPVENARVAITDEDGNPVVSETNAGVWMESILIGPSGEARLTGLPAQRLRFEVRVPELPKLPLTLVDLREARNGEPLELRVASDLSSPRRDLQVELAGDLDQLPLFVRVHDTDGRLAAGWTVRRGEEGLRIAKPLRHLVVRFDEDGLLTNRGQIWLPADSLTRDHGARLIEVADHRAVFGVSVPRGGGRLTVERPEGEVHTLELADDDARVTLQLP